VAQGDLEYIDKLLQSFRPAEVIFQRNKRKDFKQLLGSKPGLVNEDFYTYTLDEWIFSEPYATETLLKHFETVSLKGFGIEGLEQAIIAAGAALHYLKETEHPNISHISSVQRIDQDTFLWMDKFTIRNLELLHSAGEKGHCLLNVLDHTLTPMGSRMLKRWMVFPLREIRKINERLDLVTFFIKDQDIANVLRHHLKQVGDMERVVSKIPRSEERRVGK